MGTEQYKGYTIQIEQDSDVESPRDWDNIGTMVCFHRRLNLGDKEHGFETPDEVREHMKEKGSVWLPLFLLDHSGLHMRIRSFSDVDPGEWDSGRVGVIFVDPEKIVKEYGKDDEQTRIQALKYLESEVEVYDQYLSGDVWGYTVTKDDEDVDSCWGFYGYEECLKEAKEIVDHDAERAPKKRVALEERVWALIEPSMAGYSAMIQRLISQMKPGELEEFLAKIEPKEKEKEDETA